MAWVRSHGVSGGRRVPAERPGAPGGVRDQNRKARVEAISRASLGLFLVRGIEPVTIDEIAAEARVAKGSFYRYFDDKEDLIDALLAPVSARLVEAFAQCDVALRAARTRDELSGAYIALAGVMASIVADSPEVVRLYLQECRAPGVGARRAVAELAARIGESAIALTVSAQTHGMIRPVDPRVSAAAVVGAAEKILFMHMTGASLGPAEALAPTLISLVLSGVGVEMAQ